MTNMLGTPQFRQKVHMILLFQSSSRIQHSALSFKHTLGEKPNVKLRFKF